MIFPYIFGKVKEYVDDDFGKDAFFDGKNNNILNVIKEIIFRDDATCY